MPYSTAWIVIAVLAVIGAFCLNSLLRGAGPGPARWPRKLRYIFVLLVFVFFLLPAPLPNHAGVFAPAFVVYLFESMFQSNGQPNQSQGILLVGLGGVCVLGLLALLLFRSKQKIDEDKPQP
ncbi:MAG: hypothetical protein ACI883_001548 [Candidatus Azotimanducaceae bacterium]|jgi:hypothetical protein|tara:strand:+ start:355 stop:720 length:366 start_codon:yes stop_codon:yes gene_type:complete